MRFAKLSCSKFIRLDGTATIGAASAKKRAESLCLDAAERKTSVGEPSSCSAARAALAACMLLCPSLPLVACAAASSYAGVPFASGAADPELQSLARRAHAGDKQAQLELGIRYEEGRGVAADRARAAKLYRLAAADSDPILHVYAPPVGRHGRGSIIAVGHGSRRPGLAEARTRLAGLRKSAPDWDGTDIP